MAGERAQRYVTVSDLPISWPVYADLLDSIAGPTPKGLVAHLAGPTDEGVREIGIWETEAAYRAFYDRRLRPALARLPRAVVFRDLQAHSLLARTATPPEHGNNQPHDQGGTP